MSAGFFIKPYLHDLMMRKRNCPKEVRKVS
jgi:hypothetical protein